MFLILGCALSTWLAFYSFQNSATDVSTNQSDTPDSFMKEVQHTRYNEQGLWESSFYTPNMVHYPKQKTAVLDDPRLNSRGENQLHWIINAKHGIAHDDGETIYLKNQVVIRREDTGSLKVATLTTNALTAYPKRKYIETDQPVKIIQPGSIINSTGFNANLDTGEIRLLSHTDSTYVESQNH